MGTVKARALGLLSSACLMAMLGGCASWSSLVQPQQAGLFGTQLFASGEAAPAVAEVAAEPAGAVVAQPSQSQAARPAAKAPVPAPKLAKSQPGETHYRVAGGPGGPAKATHAPAPVADLCPDPGNCVATLRAMLDDPDRAWIAKPEAPATFANGVRLFAYRALRGKLACGELVLALREIDGAAKMYAGSVSGLKPEQATRARGLATAVGQELREESARRCTANTSPRKLG